jgi:hypothetical protein
LLDQFPSVKGNCLTNFSATTTGCENCAWQVVLLQYTSHYFSHCNSDQWSRWGTFPVRITTTLDKETASLQGRPSLLPLKQKYAEHIIFIYKYFWCKTALHYPRQTMPLNYSVYFFVFICIVAGTDSKFFYFFHSFFLKRIPILIGYLVILSHVNSMWMYHFRDPRAIGVQLYLF